MAGRLQSLTTFNYLLSPSPLTQTNTISKSHHNNNHSFSNSFRNRRSKLIIKNHNQGNADQPSRNSTFSVLSQTLLHFSSTNILPLALIGGVVFGLINPTPGCLAHKYQLSKVSTFGIFIISGLTLRSEDIGAAVEAWPVGLFGLASILLFTPNLSRFILQFHLQPQEFVTGLALFSCMPTTLSSGVSLTRLAGGNSALALAMTVTASSLAILIVPFSISKLIASGLGASVPAEKLFRRLIFTLLMPLILGKAFRESFKCLADFADNNRKLLSVLSVVLLSWVPWIQVSRSRSLLLMLKPTTFLIVLVMGICFHLILLGFNAISIQCLCAVSGGSKSIFAKKENSTALLLVASQKALPVLVAVVDQLGSTFGESGLLIIPCVAGHLIQIIMDSFIVSFWNKKETLLGDTKVA